MGTHLGIANSCLRILDIPVAAGIERLSTKELRDQFLVQGLFQTGEMNLAYTSLDRLVVGGVMPVADTALPGFAEFGTRYFTERRELGILNIGGEGAVSVGGRRYVLAPFDFLYVGLGEPDIVFESTSGACPAFYLASAPAHHKYPTARLERSEAQVIELGEAANVNRRRIVRYLGGGRIQSCQLVMGITEVLDGSVWNTLPPHTHSRRSEVYLYFDMEDRLVLHLMGAPDATRHLVVRNREAVLSPRWSLHMGVGTGSYKFLWAMAGENQEFGDVDAVDLGALM
jgi:4-deoxy-L-threo-5-hexosulose-uronate ketol-isomerase